MATYYFLTTAKMLAEWTGLEPATPGVTGRYSNQLNYHSRMYYICSLLQACIVYAFLVMSVTTTQKS